MDTQLVDSNSDSRRSSVTSDLSRASSALHRYSCIRCRARKVKCDKIISGCLHCQKARARCVYSARRSRKTQKPNREISMRPLLPTDGGGVIGQESRDGLQYPLDTFSGFDERNSDDDDDADDDEDGDDEGDRLIPREAHDVSFQARCDGAQSEHGRLFVSQGKSRYINSQKARQLVNFEQVLAAEPVPADNSPSLSTWTPSHKSEKRWITSSSDKLAGSSLLQVSNGKRSLQSYHPALEIRSALWDCYIRNVDFLIKIIYKPAAEVVVKRALGDSHRIDAATEAFLFAIYFAAVTTMSAEECMRVHQEQRPVLLQRYQNALEQALTQAGWMTTQDIIVLQAMILLMVFTPKKNVRSTWMLIGSAMGIAQAMGMHRDSASFALCTADIELRRRVWWTLCLLDNRISDDCGLEVHVPATMDTKLPLHVNDTDIAANETGNLLPRTEFTEMTMSLVKLEMAELSLRVKMFRYGQNPLSVDQIELQAHEKIQHYTGTYLQYLNSTSHLTHLCHLGARLIMANIWKMAHDQCRQRSPTATTDDKEGLLKYNTEVLEITHQLPNKSSQYGWFFGCKYTQWHAMAYLLIELRHHPLPSNPSMTTTVDRAWDVLDSVFRDFNDGKNTHHHLVGVLPAKSSKLWPSLLRLSERQRHLRKKQTSSPQQPPFSLSPDTKGGGGGGDPATFGAMLAFDSGYETNVSSSNEEPQSTAEHIPVGDTATTTTTAPAVVFDSSVLHADPFLGSSLRDFDDCDNLAGGGTGDEMMMTVDDDDWAGFDALLQNWQSDLARQQQQQQQEGCVDFGQMEGGDDGGSPAPALAWW